MVHGPMSPYIVNGPRDRRVQVGQSIQLTCRIVGQPWPLVKWFKDGQEITSDGKLANINNCNWHQN